MKIYVDKSDLNWDYKYYLNSLKTFILIYLASQITNIWVQFGTWNGQNVTEPTRRETKTKWKF